MVLFLSLSCAPRIALAELPGLPAWTADGLWYLSTDPKANSVWPDDADYEDPGARPTPVERASLVSAQPVDGGERLVWLESYQQLVPGHDELKKELAGTPDKAALDAWLAEHPLGGPGTTGAASPTGAKAVVLLGGKPAPWADQKVSTAVCRDTNEDLAAALLVSSGEHTWSRVDHVLEGMPTAFGAPEYYVRATWSPTGARVMWTISGSEIWTMRGPTGVETFTVFADAGPRVQLKAATAVEAHLPAAQARLEAAGFPVTVAGVSQQEREKSTVYVRKGMEEQGKAIAAALPGGALVEELTWDPKEDVVVALGRSVAPR